MKKIGLTMLSTIAVLFCSSCKNQNDQMKHQPVCVRDTLRSVSYAYPYVLPVDSANKMINSYLTSINYEYNDTDLQSLTFNAALIRYYLDSVAGSSDIQSLKIAFAHTLNYINAGHGNEYAGYKSGALTVIISAYKANGDYVYLPQLSVADNGAPCPSNCPPGPAQKALFPVPTSRK